MYHFSLKKIEHDQFRTYLNNWFCDRVDFEKRCNIETTFLDDLFCAGGAPSIVYRLTETGYVWSALSDYTDQEIIAKPAINEATWLTPAALPWVRAAKLYDSQKAEQIAEELYNEFAGDFERSIQSSEESLFEYVDQIGDADGAWQAWIKGAYAVCMRSFSASLVVEKLLRRLRAKELIGIGVTSLSLAERRILLTDVTRLSDILTPFSPIERKTGTPGTVIDLTLNELGLGNENPFNSV